MKSLYGGPNGSRTRVTDVRGRCPRPLDDGTSLVVIDEQYSSPRDPFNLIENIWKIKNKMT